MAFRFPSGLAGEPKNHDDYVHIDCDDIQVFIAKAALALPRPNPGVIKFTMPDVGWFSIELDQTGERKPAS
jgi:hypothetical protein